MFLVIFCRITKDRKTLSLSSVVFIFDIYTILQSKAKSKVRKIRETTSGTGVYFRSGRDSGPSPNSTY